MKAKLIWFLPIDNLGYRIIVCEFFGMDSRYSYDLSTEFFTQNEIGQMMGGN
jgi:hypothetical protein